MSAPADPAARDRLVASVSEKGIQDPGVLRALRRVPRDAFVPPARVALAWIDEPLPIGHGQTISQPFTVAIQTSLLAVQPGDRVLEIGTGSGYQAAILCALGAEVFSIERIAPLHEETCERLSRLHCHAHLRLGDGTAGWPEAAPFDAIVVTAAAPDIPPALISQLRIPGPDRPGGRLVMPVGEPSSATMTRLTRTATDDFRRDCFDTFHFVPLVTDTPPLPATAPA